MFVFFVFFFFKQKTAYEMRISDWSSDVCSSDLLSDNNCSKDDAALNPPKKKAPSRPGKQTVTTPLTRSKDAKKLSTGKKVEVGTRMSGTPVRLYPCSTRSCSRTPGCNGNSVIGKVWSNWIQARWRSTRIGPSLRCLRPVPINN